MTDIPIADQIAAVQLEVSRMQANAGDWKLYLEKLPPESTGHKSAMISLKHMARLNDAIATLQSYERLHAEHERAMKVIECAWRCVEQRSGQAVHHQALHEALRAYDAALATQAGPSPEDDDARMS